MMMRMKLVSGHQQCCELLDGSIPVPPLTLDCIQLIMIVFNGDDDDADNDDADDDDDDTYQDRI